MEWVIDTQGLSKSYRSAQALKSPDLRVAKNSIFGFRGPNGAGKTTTLETQHANQQSDPAMLKDQRIRQAQSGNLDAFNELVLAYQDQVFRQALWILGDEAAAEDACQEAFLLAYRNLHTFRGGPFRPWLMRIVMNYCISQIRAAKRHPSQPLIIINEDGEEIEPYWVKDPGDSPEKALERAETGEAILRSIQKLAPEYRVPVILVDLQDMDYAEASAVLQVPMGTFKSRLSRARQKLREDLLLCPFCCCSLLKQQEYST